MTRTLPLLATLLAALAGPAMAHVSFEAPEAEAGSTYKGVLRVGHGCDGLATNVVRVRIPDGVINAKPMPKPGWTLETVVGPYAEPAELHGETVTEGVREIVWSGGELPDAWFDEFVIRATLPQGEPGQVLVFPVVQECGETAKLEWVEVAAEGQDPHALEFPAPTLTLSAPAHTH
jgi:periplasmic copper chaperone A